MEVGNPKAFENKPETVPHGQRIRNVKLAASAAVLTLEQSRQVRASFVVDAMLETVTLPGVRPSDGSASSCHELRGSYKY